MKLPSGGAAGSRTSLTNEFYCNYLRMSKIIRLMNYARLYHVKEG